MFEHVIIGGGITGLSCAHALQRAGSQAIAIVEPGPLGGLIKTTKCNGFTLEQGPNVLLAKPHLLRLVSDLGLESDMVGPAVTPYRQYVWHDDRAAIVPKNLTKFLTTPLLSWSGRIRLLRAMVVGSRPHAEDETVAQFFSRIIGSRGVHTLLDPALKGIFGGNISRLSAEAIFPLLWEHLQSGGNLLGYLLSKDRAKPFVLRNGMSSLIEALQNTLSTVPCHRSAVQQLAYDNDVWRLTLDDGETWTTKHVYITTAGKVTAKFLDPQFTTLLKLLEGVEAAPLQLVHVAVSSTQLPSYLSERCFGVLFPSGFPLLGVMTNSVLFPHMAPRGKHLLTVCSGGTGATLGAEPSHAELHALVREELRRRFALEGEILATQCWKAAIPQYQIGHQLLVRALRECEVRHPGIHFIGADHGGVGVPDRVRCAVEASA